MAERQDAHAGEAMAGPHGSEDDHGGDHGHDDHGHPDGGTLGPLDIQAWGAGLFGVLLGLVVAFAFVQAAG